MSGKLLLSASVAALAAISAQSQAWELELPIGFGMSGDPIMTYTMTDGSVRKFHGGQGLGLLVADQIANIGPATLSVRGGFQYGFLNTAVTATSDLKDRYTYFPVYADISFPLSNRMAVSAGITTRLMTRYTQSYQGAKDVYRLQSNIGYDIAISYDVVPASAGDPLALYYFARYESSSAQWLNASLSDGSSQTFSSTTPELNASAGYIGLGFRF